MLAKSGISKTGKEFIPLVFAGDINVYSVARAFHEEYGCVTKCFGKYNSGPCKDSAIIDYTPNVHADEPETFFKLASDFANEHKDKTIILLGCGDNYIELASQFKDKYPSNVIAPYIDVMFMRDLINKERFYELCERYGVDYPDTFIHKKNMGDDFELPFDGPFIVKPANGVEYWKHPYPTQKKAYKLDTVEEVHSVLHDIYGAGYKDSVIIQNFIPGDDSYMRVLTSYSGQDGKVKMMCLGHVLLEEHTPHGIGNHAVILTEYDEALMLRFKKLLEELRFTGFSNFDIKYDQRDKKFKAFEINCRQGRSNYYVTGSGANIAKYLVEDLIDHAELPLNLVNTEHLWMVIPKKVAYDYSNPAYKKTLKRLVEEGKYVNPLLYNVEKNPKKLYTTAKNVLSHYYKYKKYLGKK